MKDFCEQYGLDYDYYILGDSAYQILSHVRSYLDKRVSNTAKLWNIMMKGVRISIE